jgi:hypothetical protein
MNRAADGSTIKLADPAGVITEWNLSYADLNDQEAAALERFFESAEGSLNEFTFLDPTGNLLAWSDQLDNDVWQKDPLTDLTGAVSDPHGTSLAWQVSNSGAASQGIYQTIAAPGGYQYCLSVYLRADAATNVQVLAGTTSGNESVTATWRRVTLGVAPYADTTSIRFGIAVGAASVIDMYGIQVDAQPGPSTYKATSRGGVYEGAHLRDDSLEITKTGLNRHSCAVNVIHANHL